MSLLLQGCLTQTCDGLSYTDLTGAFAAENPGGYGTENGVTGPADFDSYELRIWSQSNDYYAEDTVPTVVFDLLDEVPTPNGLDQYTWEFTTEEVGVPTSDGTWYWEVVGIKDADEYTAQGFAIFLNTLRASFDAKVKGWDPTCPCKSGCADVGELYSKFLVLECFGTCDSDSADDVIKWLNSKLKTCC